MDYCWNYESKRKELLGTGMVAQWVEHQSLLYAVESEEMDYSGYWLQNVRSLVNKENKAITISKSNQGTLCI